MQKDRTRVKSEVHRSRGCRRRDLKTLGEGLFAMKEDKEFQIGITSTKRSDSKRGWEIILL